MKIFRKRTWQVLICFITVCINLNLSAQEVPLVSSSSSPIWYRVQLSSWTDEASRAQRYLSDNGTVPVTIDKGAISNADANLWRLDGSALTGVKVVCRNANKELYTATGSNNTPLTFAISGSGTSWNTYANSAISNSYYMGIATAKDVRINAGGVVPGSFLTAWGVGLYDQADKASAWMFMRVYGATVTVEANVAQGSAYIGSTGNAKSAEVMSGMTYEIHAVPTDGYIFKEWQQNGTAVSNEATYSVKTPSLTANTSIAYTAVFEKDIVNRTATPIFKNESQTFKIGSEAIVNVSCTDASAVIYYTLNGSDPTATSSVAANGKIILDSSSAKTYTIKIAAKGNDKELSRVATASYAIISSNAPAALLPIPNERQLYYMKHPNAAFIHYGMNTYTNKEWGTGNEKPSTFNPPKEVNTDQWVEVLKECGFDRVVLTGKHHDGFCLWPSKANTTNPHTIAQSPYKDGKGDLFEQLSVSCTKFGLDMGVYLSPWDAYEENVGGHYTSTLYNDFYNTQLNEVLGKYGRYNEKLGRREITEIWLDGATGSSNPPVYDFNRFANTMRQHQPTAFIWIDALPALQKCIAGDTCKVDGAWAMNEAGQAPDPCWNKMSPEGASSTDACKNKPNGKYSLLLEADVSMRNGWFYGDGGGLKSAVDLFKERYLKSVGRGVPLILNIPPDTNGEFAAAYVAVLKKYKEYLDVTFKHSLIPAEATATASQVRADEESFAANKVLDDNYDTYWTMNDGQTTGTITIEFGMEKRFDIVEFQEYVPLGQRISGWKVEVKVAGKWAEFAVGTTVGFKRIVKGKEVQASGVRLTITSSLAVPLINAMAVYRSHEDLVDTDLPPAVGEDGQFEMDKDFMVAHETDGTVDVKVTLKERSDKPVTVYVATVPGTGVQGKVYQDKTETLTFEKGVDEKVFTVNLINNVNAEGGKDFYVEISNPSVDASIGKLPKTRIWVADDENPGSEYTLSIAVNEADKGEAGIIYPEDVDEKTITSTTPVQLLAIPKDGYAFVKWANDKTEEMVSKNARFVYEAGKDITLKAYFDENYPVMKHTYTNNINQQNRYLKSVTTTGTKTPVVFAGQTIADLPYTAFLAANIGTYIEDGALINKRQVPIELDYGTKSFTMTFLGWTTAINGNSSELNWTQQAYFIDWDKNGKFTDANEISTKSSNTIGNDGGASASFISPTGYKRTITVPDGQPAGTYRMRVVYYEPESNTEEWHKLLFTSHNMCIRNGLSYDFDIKINSQGSGINSTKENEATIYGVKGGIYCQTSETGMMTVYSSSGVLVKQVKIDGEQLIPIAQGLYIVSINGQISKVSVQ